MTPFHSPLTAAVTSWYDHNARDLPWRAERRTPWGVLVSEIMLQQTPVSRVLPAWREWMARWPAPADLAADTQADAIRAWGRLGYPRRALRLHSAATLITERHGGAVPRSYDALLALPGIGDYTAAAVVAFAFGQRHVVLDTNVRRVLARAVTGVAAPPASPTTAERMAAEALLPEDGSAAAKWSVAAMELGALVCTARSPGCAACPLAGGCAWRAAGYPGAGEPSGRVQPWEGTDRQARGRLMAALRDADGPVARSRLDRLWPDAAQRERALAGLVSDGLVRATGAGYTLPD